MALNAASDFEDRECKLAWRGTIFVSQKCMDAQDAYDLALKELRECRGSTIGPGIR